MPWVPQVPAEGGWEPFAPGMPPWVPGPDPRGPFDARLFDSDLFDTSPGNSWTPTSPSNGTWAEQ